MLSNANAIDELHSLFEQCARQMSYNNNNKWETTKTGSRAAATYGRQAKMFCGTCLKKSIFEHLEYVKIKAFFHY